MLFDNDVRALHFSRTSADLAESLGLGEYVVMQGHVRKVVPLPARPSFRSWLRSAYRGT